MSVGNRNFAATIYAPDQLKYPSGKVVAFYAVKTVGVAPECSGGCQVDLMVCCVTFVTYNNANNTYKYIVFFIDNDTTYNGNTSNVYTWTL